MRVLIFHGYLLSGTGSNVYNARLAEALVALGHEVHLLSQDRHPESYPFVDAIGDWDGGALRVRTQHPESADRPGRCTVYRPDIGDLLPVYVGDRYEGIEARPFAECSEDEVAHYIDANVAAVGELLGLVRPEVALANHLVMGPVILARALAGEVPYAVKIHGSALEYTVKPHSERFLALAEEGVAGARAILVGSQHTAASLWEALPGENLPERTRLGPPGVDVELFAPRDEAGALAGMGALVEHLRSSDARGAPSSAFARDERAAAEALEGLEPGRDRLVAFVGKLIVSKGIDLLIAAWPLVRERVPGARLVEGDMAAFDLGRRFDVVVCVFDSVNHLLDVGSWASLFAGVHAHLAGGGLFVLDVNTVGELHRQIAEESRALLDRTALPARALSQLQKLVAQPARNRFVRPPNRAPLNRIHRHRNLPGGLPSR